ncbi:MAG: alpha-L-fucosidase [Candidatus Cryptobacteroides sp.]
MSNHRTIRRFLAVSAIAFATASSLSAQGYVPSEENLLNRKEFSESRFGIFIHWGIYSMLGDGEWAMHNLGMTVDEYSHLAAGFCPSRFDAREWVHLFKEAGARYMTITSRHHDGFSMFATKASPYNIVDATPFKRDVLKELAEACAEEGLKLNFYYSHLDWSRNDYYPRGNTGRTAGRPDEGDWNSYLNFMNTQLTELLSNYGPIGCIWFDGVWDKAGKSREELERTWKLTEQYRLIHSIQPGVMIGNNHHLGVFEGEDMQMFERDLPGQNTAGHSAHSVVSENLPLETCQTINNNWGYQVRDNAYKSVDELIRLLVKTASNNANLLLNIGPRPDGTIPEEAAERLRAMGKWLGKYGETIYGTCGGCVKEQSWGVTTQKENRLYLHVLNPAGTILVPISGSKLLNAVSFDDGNKVKYTQLPEGIVLTLPERPEGTTDQIITLTFKQL